MKRYFLFAGYAYYPDGGWHDFQADFDSVAAAKDFSLKGFEWAHLVDTEIMNIVCHWHDDKGWKNALSR